MAFLLSCSLQEWVLWCTRCRELEAKLDLRRENIQVIMLCHLVTWQASRAVLPCFKACGAWSSAGCAGSTRRIVQGFGRELRRFNMLCGSRLWVSDAGAKPAGTRFAETGLLPTARLPETWVVAHMYTHIHIAYYAIVVSIVSFPLHLVIMDKKWKLL